MAWRFITAIINYKADDFDESTYVRGGAPRDDIRPWSHRGSLYVSVLKKHGCNAEKVKKDPLFLFQMLVPFMNPKLTRIEEEERMPLSVWYVQQKMVVLDE